LKWVVYSLGLIKERWNYYGLNNPTQEDVRRLWDGIRNRYNCNIFEEIAEHDMREMMEICRANNIRVIICSYPIESGRLYYIHKSIAQKFKVPFVDNFETFKRLSNKEKYLSKNNFGHPNEEGYRIIAENIYRCIIENGLIK